MFTPNHMPHGRCQASNVFFWHFGGYIHWRVCYQRGLPRLLLQCTMYSVVTVVTEVTIVTVVTKTLFFHKKKKIHFFLKIYFFRKIFLVCEKRGRVLIAPINCFHKKKFFSKNFFHRKLFSLKKLCNQKNSKNQIVTK